jgi:hypothetical protein
VSAHHGQARGEQSLFDKDVSEHGLLGSEPEFRDSNVLQRASRENVNVGVGNAKFTRI